MLVNSQFWCSTKSFSGFYWPIMLIFSSFYFRSNRYRSSPYDFLGVCLVLQTTVFAV